MPIEITSKQTLEPTIMDMDFLQFVNDCNTAAAAGKHFVIGQELGRGVVAIETQNITRIREIEPHDTNPFV